MNNRSRSLAVLALAAALTACGGTEPVRGKFDPRRANEIATPRLVSWSRWDGPLFRLGTQRAFYVIFRSPDDRSHFRAVGLDQATSTFLFYVDGSTETDYPSFDRQLRADLVNLSPTQNFDHGGVGDLIRPPPVPPLPEGDGLDVTFAQQLLDLANVTLETKSKVWGN